MTTNILTPLVVRRQYKQDRERVFDAFASANALEKWFSPAADIATKVIELDFRPGGRYRIAFSLSDGTKPSVTGEYVRIDRPIQLCFTWSWEEPDPHAGIDTLVTIDFIDKNGTTELVVSHEKMDISEMRQRHSAGWLGALERLDRWLQLLPETA